MFALVALFASSCVKDLTTETSVSAEKSASAKIINTSQDAASGQLILFVDEETAEMWASAECATRSGNMELDAVVHEIGATSIESVFNMDINGDQKRALDMHRWFVAEFDESADLDIAAEKFAAMDEVDRVQFATKFTRPNVSGTAAKDVVATRSSEMPFNDPQLELQWHYNNQGLQSLFPGSIKGEDINAFAAWKHTSGNRDIIVAIVDEGVCYSHEDLKDNMWVNEKELNGAPGVDDDGNGVVDDIYGYNTITDDGNISWNKSAWYGDEYIGDCGHGTHVAGTVAAVNNNGLGVAGVAGGDGSGNGVRLMSIQIFSGPDNAQAAANAKGIEYAADNGACILQNSWGYPQNQMSDQWYEQALGVELAAIRYFESVSNCSAMDGNVVIFAAGNQGNPFADYPGAYRDILCVTAYAPDGLPTSYTNYKLGCNVSAPGGDMALDANRNYLYSGGVLSTLPADSFNSWGEPYGTHYGYMQGTSMACPHVSGVAALVLSYAVENNIKLTNTELYDILSSSVREIDSKLKGSKPVYTGGYMSLDPYRGGMGTGKLDALMAIMSLRGADCIPVIVGQEFELKPGMVVGDGTHTTIKGSGFDIDDETKNRLGIDKVDFFGGNLYFTCENAGIGVITLKYIAGGDKVGGGATIGGRLTEKEVVIVARDANDNGGWL